MFKKAREAFLKASDERQMLAEKLRFILVQSHDAIVSSPIDSKGPVGEYAPYELSIRFCL